MKCPPLLQTLVIADDPHLAAKISCALAKAGHYLPVMEGPRMQRQDRDIEVVRKNNGAARLHPTSIFLTGLQDDAFQALTTRFTGRLKSKIQRVSNEGDIEALRTDRRANSNVVWGRDRIGLGLLKALRVGSGIVFEDKPSPNEAVPSKSLHLVVCEEGDELAQVIAANYAFSLKAGLCLIPEVEAAKSDELLERFYSLYDEQDISASEALEQLKHELLAICGALPVPHGGSITFITGGVPFGFAVTEFPSTHLFKYPELGLAIVNGLAAEQPDKLGVGFVVLVDPNTTDAHEIDAAERLLPPHGAFIRTYYREGANVRHVTEMMELLPYDLLIIATHCGDVSGYRWTYEFKDSEGIGRTLVVDIAIGVARTDDNNMLNVTQFMRFISLDGVDWNDPKKAERLYVGRAILDFIDKTRGNAPERLEPVKKQTVSRVLGSAALKMYDQNIIVLPRPLADEGTPIIINNACVSWHRLAQSFTFSNARAYVGTLFPVHPYEAQEVVIKLLGKHFGKPLPTALWSAQREVYGSIVRRPYVMTGVYPQYLRIKRHNVAAHIGDRLFHALNAWRKTLPRATPNQLKMVKETITFYERELEAFRKRWLQ
jgi:hypothetical protein